MTFLLCSGDGECGACTDPDAINYEAYDPASVFYDDGSCIPAVLGCNAPTACNYNEAANTNDGSCFFQDALGVCGGTCFADEDGHDLRRRGRLRWSIRRVRRLQRPRCGLLLRV